MTTPSDKYSVERAVIGVDGNCGFALLGENLQEGEAEFVEVGERKDEHIDYARSRAAGAALRKLESRLGKRLAYALDPSHPRYC